MEFHYKQIYFDANENLTRCELQHGHSDHRLICVSLAFIIQLTKYIFMLCKYIIR